MNSAGMLLKTGRKFTGSGTTLTNNKIKDI